VAERAPEEGVEPRLELEPHAPLDLASAAEHPRADRLELRRPKVSARETYRPLNSQNGPQVSRGETFGL